MNSWWWLLILCGCFSCNNNNGTPHKNGPKKKLLAQVYNKQLYTSDLDGILPEQYKPEDSIMIHNAYIENWLRDAVLMQEAEHKIAQNIDIDQLVKDYRSTLILHNYEEIIIKTQLDSTITETQINDFYEANKDSYQLKNPLARLWYMKIPKNSIELEQVDKWWQSSDTDDRLNLIDYCMQYAEVYYLNNNDWSDLEKIKRTIPTNLVPQSTFTQAGANITRSDDQYKYYLRILEIIEKNESPPIDYIRKKAQQVILQRRKSKLLAEHREKLYEKEINNVKVFTQ